MHSILVVSLLVLVIYQPCWGFRLNNKYNNGDNEKDHIEKKGGTEIRRIPKTKSVARLKKNRRFVLLLAILVVELVVVANVIHQVATKK